MEPPNFPYVAVRISYVDPRSNIEYHELENWLAKQFKCNSIAESSVECVPTSTLINSFFSSNQSTSSAEESVVCIEDTVFEQCLRKYFEILGDHFEEQSIGGNLHFLPVPFLNQAFIEAHQQSDQHCKKLCDDNQFNELTTAKLEERLRNFFVDAQAKILEQNENNCLGYLERNKRSKIERFCKILRERFKFLYQEPMQLKTTGKYVHYNSTKMTAEVRQHILDFVSSWNKIKSRALPDLGEQAPLLQIRQVDYDDDVEKSLNSYLSELVDLRKRRNEKIVYTTIDIGFEICKKTIEKTVTTAKYLNDLTDEDISRKVTTFQENYLIEMKVLMEDLPCSVPQQVKCKLQEKGDELQSYGNEFVRAEIDKERKAMHLESMRKMKELLENQQKKHRLKQVRQIYEQHVLAAFEDVIRHFANGKGTNDSDGESTETCSRETLSVASSSNSNIVSGRIRDRNENPNADSNVDPDDDSEENDIAPLRPKRRKKRRLSKVKRK